MSQSDNELLRLLDELVTQLASRRLTFTDEAVLTPIWERGYDIAFQEDPLARFALVAEANRKHRRQWRLHTQTAANNRLLDALVSGTWDGRDLETELARLDAADNVHYIFCPSDPRFTTHSDGRLEPTDQERNIVLPPPIQAELAALSPLLLQQWQSEGAQPHTVRHITEMFGHLGWSRAQERDGWLLVRTWLSGWSEVQRVGQDYWLPANAVPHTPIHSRLQVLPLATLPNQDEEAEPATEEAEMSAVDAPAPANRSSAPALNKNQMLQSSTVIAQSVSWTQPLRTLHLLEGFLPVPSTARSAYPPRIVGEGEKQVLRGLWFDSDEQLWLWLDRTQDRLYGPELAHQLEWREAGDLLRIEWRPEIIVLRPAGHDDDIQREELRLVDPEELKALRGGLGESYRQSLQAILSASPEGLTFAQVVTVLRERQAHDVHHGTVRTLLYAGDFIHRDGRWYAASQSGMGARKLRAALMESMVPGGQGEQAAEMGSDVERRRQKIRAIRGRLAEVVEELRKNV